MSQALSTVTLSMSARKARYAPYYKPQAKPQSKPSAKLSTHRGASKSDPRSFAAPMHKFGNKWVTIRAGLSEEEFGVHKDVLVAKSPFFQRMFAANFIENEKGIVYLPEDNSRVDHAYINYLYSGSIVFDTDVDKDDNEYWELPLKMWLFGHKIQGANFADMTIDASIHQTHDVDIDGGRWFPVGSMTSLVYKHTISQTSPLRRLLVDQHWYHGRPSWLEGEGIDPVDPQFSVDLALKFMRSPSKTSCPAPDKLDTTCNYHLHKEGQCYKQRNA